MIDEYANLSEFNNRTTAVGCQSQPRNLKRDKQSRRLGNSEFSDVLEALSDSLTAAKYSSKVSSDRTASTSIYKYMEDGLLHTDDVDLYSPDTLIEDLILTRSMLNMNTSSKLKKPRFIESYRQIGMTIPDLTQNALIELYQIDDYTSDESNDLDGDTDILDSGEDDDERYPSLVHASRLVNTPISPNENIDDVFDSGHDSFDDYDSYLSQIDNVSDIAPDSDIDTANSEMYIGSKDNAIYDDDDSSDFNSEIIDNFFTNDDDSDSDDEIDNDEFSNFDLSNTELGSEDDSTEYDDYLSNEGLDTALSAVGAVSQDATDMTEDSYESGGSGGSDGFIGSNNDSPNSDELQYYVASDYEFDSSYHPEKTNNFSPIRYDFNPSPYDESLVSNTQQEFEFELADNAADNFDTEYIEYDRRSLRLDSAELGSEDLEYVINNYLDNSSEEIANLTPNSPISFLDNEVSKRRYGSLTNTKFSTNEENIEYDDGVDVDASSDEYLRTDLGTETAYSIAQSDPDISVNTISDYYEADTLDDMQDCDDDSHDKELLLEYEPELDEMDFDWDTRSALAVSDDGSTDPTDYDTSVFDEYDDSTDSTQDVDLEVSTPIDYNEILADNSSKLRSQIISIDGDVDDTNNSDDSIYISDENDIGGFSDGGTWVLPVEDYYAAQSTD